MSTQALAHSNAVNEVKRERVKHAHGYPSVSSTSVNPRTMLGLPKANGSGGTLRLSSAL
ncbi:hypothetical protein CC1G_11026 [Coprinopsis cinerea okayama7|uniref:Uncharacterized protein n=1 Tax=Coprinopsis cinerea (strain Okayama-7 / 130 / ATCC MYA-4618 / FGSC 9003) TaxID=240176 RepID=A8NIR8_COPC7|nr:hypothetical protein CC1G_11026 [Coprinopsis cinerea okayama7\|eukprot:XP_001834056.2 hypothetical protein CC1G_11026 [Coprinopsis cinerea okayama7\